MSSLNIMYPNDEFLKDISNVIGKVDSKNETQIKKEIEQVGYKEFYRYYKEKDIYIKQLQQENQKYKEVIDKAIKCIDYNTKYRNGADIYQFVDIESEILEPLKYILESDEKNGNAYLKEFNDWLKEVK